MLLIGFVKKWRFGNYQFYNHKLTGGVKTSFLKLKNELHTFKQRNKRTLMFWLNYSLSNATGIKPDNLYTNFNRKGLNEFENDNYRIVKTDIIRSK
jgi:hypothetical protein